MAVSEVESSTVVPPIADIHNALTARARRKQRIAQAILFLRTDLGFNPEAIRERLGITEDEQTGAEALIFQAKQAVTGTMPDLLDGDSPRVMEMALGQLIVSMQEIMSLRVRHAEQILTLRGIAGLRTKAEIIEAMGVDEESYRVADRWLQDAAMLLQDD